MNYFDQPAQSQMINTYVQAPYQEILQAGLARQGRYDETLGAMQANQEYLDQLQAIEGTVHEEYLNKARTSIGDIASSFANKDLSDPFIRRQLRDEIRRKIDPATISRITESKKNYDTAQKMKAELDMRGLYYEPFDRANDPALNKTLGVNQLYQYTPRAFQDPDTYAGQTYFNVINPRESFYNDPSGQIIRTEQRNKQMIDQAVDQNWRSFADTPQGQWVISQYNGPEKDPEKIAKGYLRELGYSRYLINNQTPAGFVPEYMMRGYEPKTTTVLDDSANTESLPNTNRVAGKTLKEQLGFNPDKIDDVTELQNSGLFDQAGNYTGKIGKLKDNFFSGFFWPWESPEEGKKRSTAKAQSKDDEVRNIIKNVKAYNTGDLDNASDIEAIANYVSAYKRIANADYNTYLFETDPQGGNQKDIITDQIISDLGGRELRISETGSDAGQPKNTLDEIYYKYGVSKNKRDDAFKTIKLTSIVPSLGGYQASMVINGEPKKFIISPNKDVQAATDLIYKATKKHLDGELGEKEITDAKGNKFIVTTVLQPNADGVYEFSSNIRTKDGSRIFPDETGEGLTDAIDLYSYEQLVANSLRYKIR